MSNVQFAVSNEDEYMENFRGIGFVYVNEDIKVSFMKTGTSSVWNPWTSLSRKS